jgi:putative transposase
MVAMKQLSDKFPRFGYRRILVFMEQLGHAMGADKALRLWQKAGLQVPRKRPRKRVAHSRPRPQLPSGANEVWAYDFVHDACANGQQLKCLTIIDEYTRECLAIDVAGSIRSNRVIEVLSRLVSERGAPRHLRSDNGPEFVSKSLLRWGTGQGLGMALIDPGKPWQNGMVESFNGKFRDECLSMEWFRSRTEAKVVIEDWRRTYNEVSPHSRSRQNDTGSVRPNGRQHFNPGSHPQELTGPKNAGRSVGSIPSSFHQEECQGVSEKSVTPFSLAPCQLTANAAAAQGRRQHHVSGPRMQAQHAVADMGGNQR